MELDEKIDKMISEIVKQVDYDTYKGIYVSPEEPDVADEMRNNLIEIVKPYIGKLL